MSNGTHFTLLIWNKLYTCVKQGGGAARVVNRQPQNTLPYNITLVIVGKEGQKEPNNTENI